MSHDQWFQTAGMREEWEAAHPEPPDPDAAFRAALAEKFPQLAAWPGKEKKSPVLPSGNGPGFEPQSNRT